MTTLNEQVQIDAINATEDVPQTFTWSGLDYTGTIGGLVTGQPLEDGGFLTMPDLMLSVSLKQRNAVSGALEDRFAWNQEPAVGQLVVIDSVTYRIERKTKDAFGAILQLDLVTPHK